MYRKLGALALALTTAFASAQSVPVEKYQLPNGMTVILAPDHGSPRVTINTWFRVGSKDEAERRSGFAHLFEHLMFMGTKRVPTGQFDKIMEGLGGANNATTSTDRTNYFSSGPSHILPTLLWLDADRLQDLGNQIDQKKLDLQREVVRNERRQSTEQQPYGKAYEAIPGLMFPVGHPYHTSVIGSHEDLQAATVDDVKGFFATYYVPSNATLVVAGDFDPATVKPYVASIFGTLPRGNDVVRKPVPPVGWKGAKKVTLTDRVQFPKVILSWHSPAAYAPGDAAARVAAAVLGDGNSSRLYEELVTKQGLASEVSVSQDSELLGSTFTIDAVAAPGVSADKLRAAIDSVVSKFVAEGPVQSELRKVVADTERGFALVIENVDRKADILNEFDFYLGEPNSFKRVLDEYRALTPEAVKAAAASILTPNRLELTVIPELQNPGKDPRDAQPTAGQPIAWAPPKPVEFKVGPGVTVSYWQRPDVPLTDIRWVFTGGSGGDPTEKLGRADIAAEMLTRGTGNLNGSEFESLLSQNGASMDASVSTRFTTVHLNTLTSSLNSSLNLVASAIKAPALLPTEFDALKRKQLADIQALQDNPTALARQIVAREYYGAEHPSGRPNQGLASTVEKLNLDDVKGFLTQVVRPSQVRVFASGSLNPEDFRRTLETSMQGWADNRMAPMQPIALPAPAAEKAPFRVVLVDRPDAPQTVVSWLAPGVNLTSPDRLPLQALGEIMGGSFTSRLNQNLREDKGYTYGAGAGFNSDKEFGTFRVNTSVRTDVTGASLKEILKELQAAGTGNVSAAEVTKSVAGYRADLVSRFATGQGTVSAAAQEYERGRTVDDLARDLGFAISDPVVNRVAPLLGKREHGVLLLVGDKGKILAQLKGLGLPEPVVVKP